MQRDPDNQHLAIVGSGAIACGLATTAAHHVPVLLLARSEGSAQRARAHVEEGLQRDGAMAQAALLALAGRERDTVAALGAIPAGVDRALEAWRRALTLRATGDWRSKQAAGASLVDKAERLRALDERIGPSAALAFLQASRPLPAAEWGRILLAETYNVEVANAFAPRQVAAELDEATRVWKAYHSGSPSPAAPRVRCAARRSASAARSTWRRSSS